VLPFSLLPSSFQDEDDPSLLAGSPDRAAGGRSDPGSGTPGGMR
jgi:hypothetical protein